MTTTDSCSTCRFSVNASIPGLLECRRRPPVDGRRPVAQWPIVYVDGWCGEHESLPTTKPSPRKRPAVGDVEARG